MEEKLINDTGFEKADIVRSLFSRCSLIELLFIEQMQRTGELKKRALENSKNDKNGPLKNTK